MRGPPGGVDPGSKGKGSRAKTNGVKGEGKRKSTEGRAPFQAPPFAEPPPDVAFFLYLRIHGCLATSVSGKRFAGSFCSSCLVRGRKDTDPDDEVLGLLGDRVGHVEVNAGDPLVRLWE
jgi:hypothetical protein